MLTKEEFNRISAVLKANPVMIEGNNIYFIGIWRKLQAEVLCRIKIKQEKRYILNKQRNELTYSAEIFNECLQKQKEGAKGYKTMQLGIIGKYCYPDIVEFAILGNATGGYYWWKCWNKEVYVSNDICSQIDNYANSMSSCFKRVKPVNSVKPAYYKFI